MRARVLRRAGLALAIACVVALVPAAGRHSGEETTASTGFGQAETLLERYELWAKGYEAGGAERNLAVPLNAVPGLTDGMSQASGLATFDMVAGTLTVEVNGLAAGQAADVWLVDNQPGRGRTVAPEAGDRMVRVGSLRPKDGKASLHVTLEGETLSTLDPDLVAVTREGEPPTQERMLAGMTTLFQRLHDSARRAAASASWPTRRTRSRRPPMRRTGCGTSCSLPRRPRSGPSRTPARRSSSSSPGAATASSTRPSTATAGRVPPATARPRA